MAFRERERGASSGRPPPSHRASPIFLLLPVLFTLDKRQSQRHTPSEAEAPEKQTDSGLGKAPLPLAASRCCCPAHGQCPSQPGCVSGAGQTRISSPFPSSCKPTPDSRDGKAALRCLHQLQTQVPSFILGASRFSNCISQGSSYMLRLPS